LPEPAQLAEITIAKEGVEGTTPKDITGNIAAGDTVENIIEERVEEITRGKEDLPVE
jgi:hypothetical protein